MLEHVAVIGIQALMNQYGRGVRLTDVSCLRMLGKWFERHGSWPGRLEDLARMSSWTRSPAGAGVSPRRSITPRRIRGHRHSCQREVSGLPQALVDVDAPLRQPSRLRSRSAPPSVAQVSLPRAALHSHQPAYTEKAASLRPPTSPKSSLRLRLLQANAGGSHWPAEGTSPVPRREVPYSSAGEEWYDTLMSRLRRLGQHRSQAIGAMALTGHGLAAQTATSHRDPPEAPQGDHRHAVLDVAQSGADLRAQPPAFTTAARSSSLRELGARLREMADDPPTLEHGSQAPRELLLSDLPGRRERRDRASGSWRERERLQEVILS